MNKTELKKQITSMLEGSKSQKKNSQGQQSYAWGYEQALTDVLKLLKPNANETSKH